MFNNSLKYWFNHYFNLYIFNFVLFGPYTFNFRSFWSYTFKMSILVYVFLKND